MYIYTQTSPPHTSCPFFCNYPTHQSASYNHATLRINQTCPEFTPILLLQVSPWEAISTLVKPASKLLPVGTTNERGENLPLDLTPRLLNLVLPITYLRSHVETPEIPETPRGVQRCLGGDHRLVNVGMSSSATCHDNSRTVCMSYWSMI